MREQVQFTSTAFPKYPNEDAELVNSNCWGKRLAEFMRDELPKHGVETEDILCEDWGWLVYVKHDAFPLWVGCAVADEEGDEDEENGDADSEAKERKGARHQAANAGSVETLFVVFVTAEPGFFKRLFKHVDTKPAEQKVLEGLRSLIEATPEIRDVVWCEVSNR